MTGRRRLGQALILPGTRGQSNSLVFLFILKAGLRILVCSWRVRFGASQATGAAKQGSGSGAVLTKLEACRFASGLTLKTQVGGQSYDSSLVLPH
jgi:hypothetical protein